jgi:hypothetical protein
VIVGPDRIRAWLKRAPKNAARVQALLQQLNVSDVVASWETAELRDGDGARMIADALQDHCNDLGAPARYSLQICDAKEKVIATKVVRASPSETLDDEDEEDSKGKKVDDASIAGVLAQILRHQEAMARMYIGSQGGVLRNMQEMLELQSSQIKELATQLKSASQRVRVAEARVDTAADQADNEETIARANAITKVSDALVQHVIPIVAARMNGASS